MYLLYSINVQDVSLVTISCQSLCFSPETNTGKQIRGQINISEHSPSNCSESFSTWGQPDACPLPQFSGGQPGTWKWVIGPFALYLIERLLRVFHALNPSSVTKVIFHPSRVVEIQMKKSKWSMRGNTNEVGEYVFLNCREISFLGLVIRNIQNRKKLNISFV